MRAEYDELIQANPSQAPANADQASAVVDALPTEPFFGWMERNAQTMMWRRLEAALRPLDGQLQQVLERPTAGPLGSVEVDPALALPAYYRETEFHIQPGGYCTSATNAFVYETGAKIVMLGENDDYLFHRLFVETALPEQAFDAILDMACGFGKSTRPLVDRYPDARVYGVDLAAPNVLLAHQQSERLGKRIHFSQQAAERTRFADASFDLVTGTMFLHEVPMPIVRLVLAEASRLLRPGGMIAFLEFGRTGDHFRDAVMDDHGARNNEPYIPHLFRTDLPRLCGELGYERAHTRPFDERGAGMLVQEHWPERSEWHFPWMVLRAWKAA